tara:strand:- start:2161 stop:3657 length:1497 start_codon:yes stop_codon:yes gene_type:complete
MQTSALDEGGLKDDGMNADPVSGNEVPSGSMASEVRDDIPAQLSEGEYVVPADVVRYYGVKFFEDLREEAKRGLADMEANGRIGGEPVPEGGPINEADLSPEEMQMLQEMMSGMAVGGQVQNPYLQQQQLYREPAPKAIGNPTMAMSGGGDTVETGPTVAQTQEQILQAGQDYKPYTTGSFLSGPSFLDPEKKIQDDNTNAPTEETEIKLWSPDGAGPTTYKSPSQDELIATLESQGYTRTDPNLNSTPNTNKSNENSTYNPFPDDDEDNTRIGRLQALDWTDQDSILEWGKEQSDTFLTKGLVGGAMATTAIANLRAGAIISRKKYGEDSAVALELDKLADAKEESLGPMGRMLGKMFGMDGVKTADKYFEAEGASVPGSTTPPPSSVKSVGSGRGTIYEKPGDRKTARGSGRGSVNEKRGDREAARKAAADRRKKKQKENIRKVSDNLDRKSTGNPNVKSKTLREKTGITFRKADNARGFTGGFKEGGLMSKGKNK